MSVFSAEPSSAEFDILIVGGSLGGVAAAWSAASAGYRVALSESTDWLGGQISAQGVSALDEHPRIEQDGATQRYHQLRRRLRAAYAQGNHGKPVLNPGGGWVSRLCFLPSVGHSVLLGILRPYLGKNLRVFLGYQPLSATLDASHTHIESIKLVDASGEQVTLKATFVLDATDTGEVLPLVGAPYVRGAEAHADTGEPSASESARPDETQAFTYGFALEYRAGENHVIPAPEGYARFRDAQPYSLWLKNHAGEARRYFMFAGDLPFWTYRRLHDAQRLGGTDIALINWHGNDYHGLNILDAPPTQVSQAHAEAKALALGFLHWLQTECPRDEGGTGYPELRLRPDIMDTPDGLSKAPYIRESRRLRALKRVYEQDIRADLARTSITDFADSVGVGWYSMDLHACVGNPSVAWYAPTIPFQIPLGALIAETPVNLIAACKNIGTTHLSNGAYRVHPSEWNIGESAGALAAYCLKVNISPQEVWARPLHLSALQGALSAQGVQLAWSMSSRSVTG